MPRLDHLASLLVELERSGLRRFPTEPVDDQRFLFACTNDYLGLASGAVSRETLFSGSLGSRASRLVHGTSKQHLDLECELAAWVGQEHALLFSSGYAANVGVLSCLADRTAVVISDELNHASIIDGCRLSRAAIRVAKHGDLDHMQRLLQESHAAAARWVVVESYYSMDADSPNLLALRHLCDQHDAFLIVDEAHALGVFGPGGAGLCAEHGVRADVLVGTLGKAVGASGAFAAGSESVRDWLYNRARSFVFSTAPSPLLSALTLDQVRRCIAADELRARLRDNVAQLRQALGSLTGHIPADCHGPIVPLVLGTAERAVTASEKLQDRGIIIPAIRPPTVPEGTSRLRLTLNAGMHTDDIARLADALIVALR